MDKYDPRYQRGKIYTITCEDGAIYVGSTIQTLNERFNRHINDERCSISKYIHNNYNGDYSKCKIKLYKNYPCNNEKVLNKKEGQITKLLGTINHRIEGRTRDEYEEYKKRYYEDNKKTILKKCKEYRIKNAEQVKEYQRNYKNKKERNEYNKQIIECDCGFVGCKYKLSRHIKTQKHIELMDKQIYAILAFIECF